MSNSTTDVLETELASYAEGKEASAQQGVSPSAVRWYFNPAAKIDVRDRIVGNEMRQMAPEEPAKPVARTFIPAGTLVPFRDVTRYVPRRRDQPPPPSAGGPVRSQQLIAETKHAAWIAEEMRDAYADTGANVIDALTGVEDEALVRSIFRLCVGPRIKVATDPQLPGEKVPVIPAMLNYLHNTAPTNIEEAFKDKHDATLRGIVEETRRQLIIACEAAVSGWARLHTEDSRQLIADRAAGHPGKTQFDRRDRRAFAALGESIPTNIQPSSNPTLEKAVELLAAKAMQPTEPDPRIAALEAVIDKQSKLIDKQSAAIEKALKNTKAKEVAPAPA